MIRTKKRFQMIDFLNNDIHFQCLLFEGGGVKAVGYYNEIERCYYCCFVRMMTPLLFKPTPLPKSRNACILTNAPQACCSPVA